MLIILSILIIGATFFSIYYFNAIKPKETPELNLDNRIFNEKINTIENIGDLEPSEEGDEDDPTISNAFANLNLILIPSGSTNINTNFGIKAVVQDVSGYNSATLLSVTITKAGITSNSCSYNGTFSSNFSDLGNLNLSENNLEISINSFSCNSPGDYMFTFRVNSVPLSTELTSNIIKTIDN